MEKLRGACIIGQSGGPTAAINSGAWGVIRAAMAADEITHVYGASHGIVGVINGDLFDLEQEDPAELALLPQTPAAALGSCRYRMASPEEDDTDYRHILEVFEKYDVRYFFYIGGNDSMDTCNKISRFMEAEGYDCRVIGIPKTIDNDLMKTDHCPGYGSAIKYIATSIRELCCDVNVYVNRTVTIVEIMGRHAGWLAAGAALAGVNGAGPDLIYLPECNFNMKKFLKEIDRLLRVKTNVMVAVSEGIHYADGSYVSEVGLSATDGFGHVQLGGLAATLAHVVREHTGAKVRGIELSLLQRCAGHAASAVDIKEAAEAGSAAVAAALSGITGQMVILKRNADGADYSCAADLCPLSETANRERKFPREWINAAENGVTEAYLAYALPLIAGEPEIVRENSLPRYAKLKRIKA